MTNSMNLNQIKQEAREELFGRFDLVITKDRAQHDFPEQEEAEKRLANFLEETLDRLLDEIEKAVVPKEMEISAESAAKKGTYFHQQKSFNACVRMVEAAFTRFKGENHD